MPSYIETIESFFIGAIRKGLTLKNADIETIRTWQERGIPIDVVRKGIADAIAKFLLNADPGVSLPTTLKYYRFAVEEAFESYERSVARGMTQAGDDRRGREDDGADLIQVARHVLLDWVKNESNALKIQAFETIIAKLAQDDGTPPPIRLNALDTELDGLLLAGGADRHPVSLVETVLERLN